MVCCMRLLITISFFCVFSLSYSQYYPAKIYSERDGLPANTIYDITQAQNGYMWFVTSKGVMTYDSRRWQLLPDSLNLPTSAFSRIKTCRDGSIWVAGQNDRELTIKYYKNSQWNTLNLPKSVASIPTGFVFDVTKSSSGYHVILATKGNVYYYNFKKQQLSLIEGMWPKPVSFNNVKWHNNSAFLSTDHGLYEIRDPEKNVQTEALLSNREILATAFHNEKVYVLGLGWLGYISDNKSLTILREQIDITQTSRFKKHNLIIDKFGRLFFSSSSPPQFMENEGSKPKPLYVEGRFYNALSNKIYNDRENNIWVGDHRGLFKFNLLKFANFNQNTGLAEDEVSAIYQKENGDIILANPGALNILRSNQVIAKYRIDQPLARVMDIAQAKDNSLYVAAGDGGLFRYNENTVRKVALENQDNDNMIITAVENFNNQLYFSTTRGIYKLINSAVIKVSDFDRARNFYVLNSDTLAILCSSGGISFLYKNNMIEKFSSPLRRLNNVYSMIRWKETLLLATEGGLAEINNGRIEYSTKVPELDNIALYCFMIDHKNNLWIGSDEGVFRWNGQQLIHFNKNEGLAGNEINRNALLLDKNNNVWIGTEMGASLYDTRESTQLDIVPEIQITSINNQPADSSAVEFPYDNNNISINFLGVSFYDEQEINYRYCLLGFESDWNKQKSGSARYTNLAPGDYTFEIQSRVSNNAWSEAERLRVIIQKPFYREFWFISLMVILIICFLYFIYRIRFYLIIKRQTQLKAQVELRTREIAQKNEEIAAQNEELKKKSEEITTINEQLEQMVEDRTSKMVEQNRRLMEYTFINSHKLRAPICRVLGLLNVLKHVSEEEKEFIYEKLVECSLELDHISQEINNTLEYAELDDPDGEE